MKRLNSRADVALSKKDIGFLQFLDQPYSIGSTMQLDQRNKLRLIIDLFEIVVSLINAVRKHLKKRKTDTGASALDSLAQAMQGDFPNVRLDFSKLSLLRGTLALPCGSMYSHPDTERLSFSWATCIQINSNSNDELMAMIYCPDNHDFWCEQNLGITRADGFCTIDVPVEFKGAGIHVWLAYRSKDLKEQSDSTYMGMRAAPGDLTLNSLVK